MLSLLVGGARSGKSALASRLAENAGGPVRVVVTAEALDAEMAARIDAHRRERNPAWEVVEEPVELRGAISGAPEDAVVVVDCLTLWVANLIGLGVEDGETAERAVLAAQAAATRRRTVFVVSNEVGSGIVPGDPVSRRYRDLLGRVNTTFSLLAAEAFVVVAGRVLPLHEIGELP